MPHRLSPVFLAAPLVIAAVVGGAVGVAPGAGAGEVAAAGGPGPSVRTVLGPSVLDDPSGIALDTAGDLFVADTDHCRVLVLPTRTGTLEGRPVHARRATTWAGGACTRHGAMGQPTGLAVDAAGDVFVAEATAARVQEVRAGSRTLVTVAGTGTPGFNGDGLPATATDLNEPTGVALDGTGDLFVADTGNCRVRVLPAHSGTLFGRPVTTGHLSTVAGTGVCGSTGQGGPVTSAELWNPVAVAVDRAGDLLVGDGGDQSVLLAPASGGTYFGTTVGAGDIAVVVGGTGSYGPYLADGLSATSPAAELNDPRGLTVGAAGALFVSDGFMHNVRVVPAVTGPMFERGLTAGDLYTAVGAVPVSSGGIDGNGTRWELARVGTAVGVAVTTSGSLYFSDGTLDAVREVSAS